MGLEGMWYMVGWMEGGRDGGMGVDMVDGDGRTEGWGWIWWWRW